MNNDVTATTNDSLARRLSSSPGVVVLVLGVLLVAMIVIGVLVTSRGAGEQAGEAVTVADLRADPGRYDNQEVTLEGGVEGIRELPYLSQYAIYTVRDTTGTILVLTQSGAPPDTGEARYRVTGRFHSKVTLDDELKQIVQDKLGTVAGSLVGALLPGVPLHVVFLEHQRYEPVV
jgi:hypothetical protein